MRTSPDGRAGGTVRAVLFDLGNTLVHLDVRWLAALAGELGAEAIDAAALARAEADVRREGWREEPRPGLSAGRVLFRAYLGAVGRRVGLGDRAAMAFADRAFAEHLDDPRGLWRRPDPEARPLLAALRAHGLGTGVVSNNDGRARAQVEALGLGPLVDVVVDSASAGARKPDPRIFAPALCALGLEAGRCLYVGDSYRHDVVGARAAGLTPILCDPFAHAPAGDVATVRALGAVLALAVGAPPAAPP